MSQTPRHPAIHALAQIAQKKADRDHVSVLVALETLLSPLRFNSTDDFAAVVREVRQELVDSGMQWLGLEPPAREISDLFNGPSRTGDYANIACPHCDKLNHYVSQGTVITHGVINRFTRPCTHCNKTVYYHGAWEIKLTAYPTDPVEEIAQSQPVHQPPSTR